MSKKEKKRHFGVHKDNLFDPTFKSIVVQIAGGAQSRPETTPLLDVSEELGSFCVQLFILKLKQSVT